MSAYILSVLKIVRTLSVSEKAFVARSFARQLSARECADRILAGR